MGGFSTDARERASADYLLKQAWLTDGGELFVRPEALEHVPQSKTAEIALKYLIGHTMVKEEAILDDERVMLNRKIVERNAGRDFSLIHPHKVEFTDPQHHVALKLLASNEGSVTHDAGEEGMFSIKEDALNRIDPEGIARENGWVGEMRNSSVLVGTSHVFRGELTKILGISHEAARGERHIVHTPGTGNGILKGPHTRRARTTRNTQETGSAGPGFRE